MMLTERSVIVITAGFFIKFNYITIGLLSDGVRIITHKVKVCLRGEQKSLYGYPQRMLRGKEKEYSKNMKVLSYSITAISAVVTMVGFAAHAETNPSATLQALSEQLRVLQEQHASSQAAMPSLTVQELSGLVPVRRGNRGAAVTAIQKYLIKTGDLDLDVPTGYFGVLTQAALEKFQTSRYLPVTGRLDAGTIANIRERAERMRPAVPEVPSLSTSPSPVPATLTYPDLTFSGVFGIPPLTMAGQPLSFSVSVKNDGSVVSPVSRMGVFVDGNYIKSVSVPAVEAGASSVVAVSVVIETAGDHAVEVKLDNDNTITEISEGNNAASVSAIVTATMVAPSVAPIGQWKLDGSGNNEISGGPVATRFGDAGFQPAGGKYGGYAYIPASGDAVRIPYHSTFDLSTAFTVEFWFHQRYGRNVMQNLVYKGTDGNYNFRIFREPDSGSGDGSVVAGYTSVTGNWVQLRSPNQLAYGAWHHVVFTKSAGGHAYYLDGVVAYSDYTGSPAARTPESEIVAGGTAIDTDFDNVSVYNYALNAAEVAYRYHATSATVQTPTVEQQLANIITVLSALVEKIKTLFP